MTKVNPAMPVLPWLVEGMKVFGLHETRDNAKLSAWLRSEGKTLGNPSKLPWCGDYVDTALSLAVPNEPRPGDLGKNPYWALNWSWLGREVRACYGAVGVFKRPSGGHVGFLVGQDKDAYCVLGGNQSDSVNFTWIAKSRCVSIRWPVNFRNPNVALPMMKRNGTPLSTNEA